MSYKPENYPQLTPCLTVQDGQKAIDFYQKAFGFELHGEIIKDENGKIQYASLALGECAIMIFPEGAYDMPHKTPKNTGVLPATSLYIYVPNVDAFYGKAIAAGAQIIMEPMDAFWGDRFCKVRDLDGHEWAFATFNKEKHTHHQ